MSPSTPQTPVDEEHTKDNSPSSKSKDQELVSGMFSELEKDPDFMLIAGSWQELSVELRQVIVIGPGF